MLTISLASRQNKRTGAREREEKDREKRAHTHVHVYIHGHSTRERERERDEEIKFCANPLPEGGGRAQSTQNVTCL